jgi:phospholipase D1/2
VRFFGQDYINARIADFKNVSDHKQLMINRSKQVRMPWHDVQISLCGEPAKDLARHFIEYWNHAKTDYEGTKKKSNTVLAPAMSCKIVLIFKFVTS